MSNRLLASETLRLLSNPWSATHAHQPPHQLQIALSWSGVRAAWQRHRSRQHIAQLDAHMLRDIGVSFSDAEAEANKPFWRP
jgi:uncharacterized protein YjiS (DUF1127 family)